MFFRVDFSGENLRMLVYPKYSSPKGSCQKKMFVGVFEIENDEN